MRGLLHVLYAFCARPVSNVYYRIRSKNQSSILIRNTGERDAIRFLETAVIRSKRQHPFEELRAKFELRSLH